MTQDLLNQFSTLNLILLVVGGTTLLAVILSAVVHKLRPNLADSGFEAVVEILRADVFALLYTIVLALVITDLSGSLDKASSTVSAEASALAGLTRAADSFPPTQGQAIRDGSNEYVHAVVEDEWPRLRTGESSSRAFAALEGLYATVQSFGPQTLVEQSFYESAVGELGQIDQSRRQRIQQSQEGLSPLLRALLIIGAVVFIILAYPASVRRVRTRALIVGATTAFVSFAYLLTMVLDYPFAGDVSVDNTPYQAGVLARYWASDVAPRPLAPEAFENLSAQDMVGVWNSNSSFGEAVFREVGAEIHGAYRSSNGTVVGTLSTDGVFRGWWCNEGSRTPPREAGEVEWRLLLTPDGEPTLLDGRWRFGAEEPFRGGWDLEKLDGLPEPPDLAARFADSASFCPHP